jgi:hypothetical protein
MRRAKSAPVSRYAPRARLSVMQTRMEIESQLSRHGATGFAYANEPGRSMVGFRLNERMLRFVLNVEGLTEQQLRSHWRALLLAIKAKLVSVAAGIEEFDEAFMAHVVMPDGKTAAEHVLPKMREGLKSGRTPNLLGFDG